MKTTFLFWHSGGNRTRWRFLGSPMGLILVLLALFVVAGLFFCIARFLSDAYFPYEGKVVEIRASWADRFFTESEEERLILQTPERKTISRVVSLHTRAAQAIRVGDRVIKERGFGNPVRRVE